jgi:hypothetical protein
MKTKGNWVIKTSAGGYWCGPAHFDNQIRKAQIYHWKEAAEEQIDVIRRRKYISDDTVTLEVIPVVEPMELPEHEKIIVAAYNSGFGAGYAEARDRIFTEIEKALKSSKTTHVGQQFYGIILEDYLAEIKKTFGGN